MRISTRGHISKTRTPAEYFAGDPSLVACWPLTPEYGLMDCVGGNHLIAADVWNGTGTFDASTGFTLTGGATISGSKLNFAALASTGASRAATVVVGKYYMYEGTVDAISGNGITCRAGTTGTAVDITTTGPFRAISLCAGSTASFILAKDAVATAVIDNVTVRECAADGGSPIAIDYRGASFNGVSNCLQSSNNASFTTSNKVSVLCNSTHRAYNTAANSVIYEHGNYAVDTNTFNMVEAGAVANDPLAIQNKNSSASDAYYNLNFTRLNDSGKRVLCATYDRSLTTNENNLYIDGTYYAASSRPNNNNIVGVFDTHIMYLGARLGTTLFFNGFISNIAVFSRILSSEEIADYYAWQKDVRLKCI